VGRSTRRKNPFSFFFAATKRDQYLEQYLLREYRKGRSIDEILEDPYIQGWSTPDERARLLERLNVVSEIGEHSSADLSATHGTRRLATSPRH
jgi:hypothetical protein